MGVTPLTTEMLAVASMDIFSNPHTSAACGPRAGEGVIRMEFFLLLTLEVAVLLA
jgi:hypothetical protein